MKVYVLMIDSGCLYEPVVNIFNVYADKDVAEAKREEIKERYYDTWIWAFDLIQ